MHLYVDDILKLHLSILKKLLSGTNFDLIIDEFRAEIDRTNYLEIAKNGLLSFNDEGSLIGAYPVSPIPTKYMVEIENIGKGYSMCAIDALGIAYTFMEKTHIISSDYTTGENIEIDIDPNSKPKYRELYVTYISSNDAGCDPAVDQCPSLNFYTSLDHIKNKEKYTILPFQEALEHAFQVFGEEGMRRCIKGAISSSQTFSLSDILVEVFEK